MNPDGNSSVFQFAFEVEKGTIGWSGLAQEDCLAGEFDAGQLLEVRIDSPRRATFGRTFPVRIRYKNIGNIDIPLSNKIFKTKNNDLVNFDRCLISRCICTSYQDPSTLKWYSICRTECGSSCSTVVNTKFVSVRLDEQNGPKNLLRAGATGEKTIFVRPTHSGYSNSGESIMKFILE
ncbi:MAG: hypothetical protein IPJ06_19440 [Saprospiraceae bacterium]|nr:hypothetical protein [Saprospiraceae bacterium]